MGTKMKILALLLSLTIGTLFAAEFPERAAAEAAEAAAKKAAAEWITGERLIDYSAEKAEAAGKAAQEAAEYEHYESTLIDPNENIHETPVMEQARRRAEMEEAALENTRRAQQARQKIKTILFSPYQENAGIFPQQVYQPDELDKPMPATVKTLPTLPTELKSLILGISSLGETLNSLDGLGQILRKLSRTSARLRNIINTTEFTQDWLALAQELQENELRKSIKATLFLYKGRRNVPAYEMAIDELRSNYQNKLLKLQDKALLWLGTTNAVDRYIGHTGSQQLAEEFRKGFQYLSQVGSNPGLDRHPKPLDKQYVPLVDRLLQRKYWNFKEWTMPISEGPGDYDLHHQELLTYMLFWNNNPTLIKALLDAGCDATGHNKYMSNLEAATRLIDKNTLQVVKLLLERKADIKTSGRALGFALSSNAPESVQVLGTLLENGAKVDSRLLRTLEAVRTLVENPEREPDAVKREENILRFELKANLIKQYTGTMARVGARVGI